jgi:hypothetical protein
MLTVSLALVVVNCEVLHGEKSSIYGGGWYILHHTIAAFSLSNFTRQRSHINYVLVGHVSVLLQVQSKSVKAICDLL